MILKTLVVGSLQVNCFIIADEGTKTAMVVDPGDEPDRILDEVRRNGWEVRYIVCTHGHFDHVGAVKELKEATGASVALHKDELEMYSSARTAAKLWGFEADDPPAPDLFVKDGDGLSLGSLEFRVLHTPGHSVGGICLLSGEVLVTGDTLFAGSVGRTDLRGGDLGVLKQSFRRLMALPESTKVLPGHGPATTIGHEKHHNMFSAEFLQ